MTLVIICGSGHKEVRTLEGFTKEQADNFAKMIEDPDVLSYLGKCGECGKPLYAVVVGE